MRWRRVISFVQTKLHAAFHMKPRTCDNMRELFILSSLLSLFLFLSLFRPVNCVMEQGNHTGRVMVQICIAPACARECRLH